MQDAQTWLGDMAPHLLVLLKIVLIVLAAFVAERILVNLLRTAYTRSRAQGHDEVTRYRFLRNALRSVIVLVSLGLIAWTIPSVRSLAVTLFAGAGILAAIIGFSAQKAFSNIISGIFIVSFKPFRVGDLIKVGSLEACEFVEFPVAWDSDARRAMAIIAELSTAHPDHIDRRTAEELERGEPVVPVRMVRIADGALLLRAYVWAREPVAARMMRYDLHLSILERFRAEGIAIALPVRRVVAPAPPPLPTTVYA